MQDIHAPFQSLHDVPCGQGFEFHHQASGHQRLEHGKMRIFRGGADEDDPAVLDVIQEDLLIALVEHMDLIDVEDDAGKSHHGVEIVQDLPDVLEGIRGAVEHEKLPVGEIRQQAGHRGFARPRRSVKEHIQQFFISDHGGEDLPLPHDVLLTDDFVDAARPQPGCQWFHCIASFPGILGLIPTFLFKPVF